MVKQGPGMKFLDVLPITVDCKVKASPEHQLQSVGQRPYTISRTYSISSSQDLQSIIIPIIRDAKNLHLKELSQEMAWKKYL